MRAYTKKIIWFFGYNFYSMISDLVFYIVNGISRIEFYNKDELAIIALISLLILIIPLLFIKDDKK